MIVVLDRFCVVLSFQAPDCEMAPRHPLKMVHEHHIHGRPANRPDEGDRAGRDSLRNLQPEEAAVLALLQQRLKREAQARRKAP